MSKEFAGLTAAVTGAGSGIGLATAKILADGGAKVYGLDIAEGGLAGVGEWLQCDVGDDASVAAAFSKISSLCLTSSLAPPYCFFKAFRRVEAFSIPTSSTDRRA